TPAPITAGTPLGDAQLNAAATGIAGVSLTGTFDYTPPRGSTLTAGTRALSTVFTPNDRNYAAAGATVSIEVNSPRSVLGFRGFFKPVKNPPVWNRVKAGSAVPLRFV